MPKLHHLLLVLLLLLANPAVSGGSDTPVDINTADAETLARVMQGVGPKKAEAIVRYREAHGPFHNVYELVRVKGIGKKTVKRNFDRLRVGNSD
ncbi:MAG: helix-hairpin-helix domain-containing protein [Gammaproteobacteria bacterium]|nr:MAG: helix-hairpin-helix domain-containing protein [Gammaproteobacteria bacterium]